MGVYSVLLPKMVPSYPPSQPPQGCSYFEPHYSDPPPKPSWTWPFMRIRHGIDFETKLYLFSTPKSCQNGSKIRIRFKTSFQLEFCFPNQRLTYFRATWNQWKCMDCCSKNEFVDCRTFSKVSSSLNSNLCSKNIIFLIKSNATRVPEWDIVFWRHLYSQNFQKWLPKAL